MDLRYKIMIRTNWKWNRIVAALCTIMINASCIPDPLDVENVPTVQPMIVVSSQIMSDTLIVVGLTRTIGALDASTESDPYQLIDQIAIKDATVTITINGHDYTLPHNENGSYEGYFIPLQIGDTCHLKVMSPSMGEVTAITTVREAVKFDTVAADLYIHHDYMQYAQIKYGLQDPEPTNYYMLSVTSAEKDIAVRNALNPQSYIKLIEDASFNGTYFSEEVISAPQRFDGGDSIAVSLTNISREYYEFLKLRIANRVGLVEYLSEPITYPTNVIGGRGYFNLNFPDIRFFVLPEKKEEG
jgi:hypothetical protein